MKLQSLHLRPYHLLPSSRLAGYGSASTPGSRFRGCFPRKSVQCSTGDQFPPVGSNLTAAISRDLSPCADSTRPDLLSRISGILVSERIKVAAMVALAMGLCNAVRVIMSVAIVPLSAVHNWGSSFAGVVQSAFLWGYLLSPVFAGALTDRHGGKFVMAWGVTLWSMATLATPWAANKSLNLLLATQAFMGLAEGVAMPSMNNMMSRWFPDLERGKAVATCMGGFHLGNVSGLLLTPVLMSRYGMDGPFVVFGAVGLVWLTMWLSYIYKDPQSHPSLSRKEYAYIEQGKTKPSALKKRRGLPPFSLLLSKTPTWAIIVAHSVNNWGHFIVLAWMPVYFNKVLGVDLKRAAWFSAVPWAAKALAGFVAGSCSDFLISSGMRVTSVRKIMQSIGFMGPAVALLGLNSSRNPRAASVWLMVAVALSAFSQAGFLVNHQDIGPSFAGVLHGLSNTAGTFAAIISTIATGILVERLGSFQAILIFTSVLYLLGTLFWNQYATGDRVFD